MTPLHVEHAIVCAVSNAWFERDEPLWRAGLVVAAQMDRTLVACIYERLRELRDDVAREAFERRVSIGEVARERLGMLARKQLNAPRRSELVKPTTPQNAGIIEPRNDIAGIARQ